MKGALVVADLYDCANVPPGDELAELVKQTVTEAGMAQVGRECWFSFPEERYGEEHGDSVVTVIVPLAESHVAVHTWPAQGFVAVDFFTCGDPEKARGAVERLIRGFCPVREKVTVLRRGERV